MPGSAGAFTERAVVAVDCDARRLRDAIGRALVDAGYHPIRVDAEGLLDAPWTLVDAPQILAIVLDLSTYPWSALARLELLREAGHQLPVVALCPADALFRLEADRLGVSALLDLPLDPNELLAAIGTIAAPALDDASHYPMDGGRR